ncbi:TonB-dependent receptor [Stagnimonas aquatica]|uniref:TonB-dependent receptor n=1 Tax=Stagnimonas aquatica TaxID=2689987 RepID=A0A3N0VMC2_9GAMM|nr:TonB-dependent receptor [Stagnimonas aquatica]
MMKPSRCWGAAALAFYCASAVATDNPSSPAAESETGATTDSAPLASIPVAAIEVSSNAPPTEAVRRPDGAAAVLEEVVVTAQRREASVQATPISMEAFSSDKLAQRGIASVEDLSGNVPSMVIEPHPLSSTTLRISIRGVGVTDAQVTQDPAVGIYLDGVYLARSAGLALDLADLERIEVLRGPQGTLYGRNTTGGAVNLVTRRPSVSGFSMQQQISVGSRDQLTAKTSFNLPITDTLAVKLAALGSRQGGFVENTGPGGDFGDREEQAYRLDARWNASERLTVDYAYDYSDLGYYNYMFQSIIPSNTPHGMADLFKPYAQSESVYATQRLSSLASGAPYEQSSSQIQGHALVLTAPLMPDLEAKYIGAYRKLIDNQYADLGGGAGSTGYRVDTQAYDGPAGLMAGGGEPTPLVIPQVYQEQWSHELQLSGRAFERVEYILGAYHFSEKGGEHGGPTHHIFNTKLDPSQLNFLLDAIPGLRDPLRDLVLPGLAAFWDYDIAIDNSATALFGQFTWTPPVLDDRLRATLGLRQSWDQRSARKDFIQTQYIEGQIAGIGLTAVPIPGALFGGVDDFVDVHAAREDRNFSPSFNLQFDVTPAATTYASYATAYKSGGFNTRDPQISAASGAASDGINYGFGFVEGFKPETVRSLELGIKSNWLKRRLRLNGAVFDSRYRDMQTNFMISGTISDTKARNAGKASMRGVELEAAFVALRNLILSLQYAYLDARVEEVIDINGNNVANLYPFIAAPPHSYVATIDWTLLRGGWGKLRGYLNYQYVGDRQGFVITEDKRGLTAIEGYGLLNARLSLAELRLGSRGKLDLSVSAKNILDVEYPAAAVDNLPHADRAVVWGEPRAYGLDLVYRY